MTRCWSALVVAVVAVAALALSAERAAACPWDRTTLLAETAGLPCLDVAAFGVVVGHSKAVLERRLEAADIALSWVPDDVSWLDERTITLLRLGKLDAALKSAQARAAAEPNAYRSFANLGTVLTFMGKWPEALENVDKALDVDPNAHFGRELIHRKFLAFMIEPPTDPLVDFLGLSLPAKPAEPDAHEAATQENLDGVVAMVSVYGATESPHLAYTLGNLAMRLKKPRTALAAYMRAVELKHPAAKQIEARLDDVLVAAYSPQELSDLQQDPYENLRYVGGKVREVQERHRVWEARTLLVPEFPAWTVAATQASLHRAEMLGLRCTAFPMRGVGASDGLAMTGGTSNKAPTKSDRALVELAETLQRGSPGCGEAITTARDALKRAPGLMLPRGAQLGDDERRALEVVVDLQMRCRKSKEAKRLRADLARRPR